MGIPGLWTELEPAATDVPLPSLTYDAFVSNSNQLRAMRIGIDASLWLFHCQKAQGGSNPGLRMLFYRLAKLLSLPILPLFVFDGPKRPAWKRGKHVQGRKSQLEHGFVALIQAFGFQHRSSPGEAEAELAWLDSEDQIDAVMTDDVDTFLFGARTVIRNWGDKLSGSNARNKRNNSAKESASSASEQNTDQDDQELLPPASSQLSARNTIKITGNIKDNQVTVYKSWDINNMPEISVSRNGLILIALLSGGDYDEQGLFRCGIKNALALAQAGFGDELVRAFRKSYPSQDVSKPCARFESFLMEWREAVKAELRSNTKGFLSKRQPELSKKFSLLTTPESRKVLACYVYPLTSASQTSALTGDAPVFRWTAPDLEALVQCAQQLFRWCPETTMKSFRNNVWNGVISRLLRQDVLERNEDSGFGPWGELVESPASKAVRQQAQLGPSSTNASTQQVTPPRAKTKKRSGSPKKPIWDSPEGKRITDFFSKANLVSPSEVIADDPREISSVTVQPVGVKIVSFGKARQHAAYGSHTEWSVKVDITEVAAITSKALDHSIRRDATEVVDEEEGGFADLPGSSQTPRKAKVDPNDPLQIWVVESVLELSRSGCAPLREALRKRDEAERGKQEKLAKKEAASKRKAKQSTLTNFMRGAAKPSYDTTTTPKKTVRQARTPAIVRIPKKVVVDDPDSSVEFVAMVPPRARQPSSPDPARSPRKVIKIPSRAEISPSSTPSARAMAEIDSSSSDDEDDAPQLTKGHVTRGRISVITISDDEV